MKLTKVALGESRTLSKKAQTRLYTLVSKMDSKKVQSENSAELLCALESKRGRISSVPSKTASGFIGEARISIDKIIMNINIANWNITKFNKPEWMPEFIAKIKINKFLNYTNKNFEDESIIKRGVAKMHFMNKADIEKMQAIQEKIATKQFTVLSKKPMAMDDTGFEKLKAAYKDIENEKYSKLMIIDETGAEKIKDVYR